MPLFGHSWDEHHQKKDDEEKKGGSVDGTIDGNEPLETTNEEMKDKSTLAPEEEIGKMRPWFTRAPSILQFQIAHRVALERQWIRDRNTSGFFALDNKAPLLLRPPPVPDHLENSRPLSMNPVDSRKQRLERANQTMANAKSLVSVVESQDRGMDNPYSDEDPMEVASRVCGTASIRTGASRRRWHRAGSITVEDAISAAASSSSMENNHVDTNTVRSGESAEGCDHRMLVELAANNEHWKAQVLKRLEAYVEETERESKAGLRLGTNGHLSEKEEVPISIDSLLFGGDVSIILRKKKQSLALPPGEMTSMLFDLVEHLQSDLPDQIFMKDDGSSNPLVSPDKSVALAKTPAEMNAGIRRATDFLVSYALGIWLKTFRPLPWKQRRALWPSHQTVTNTNSSVVSSRMDDSMSLSMASVGTVPKSVESKRKLREVIEDMELDHETRRET